MAPKQKKKWYLCGVYRSSTGKLIPFRIRNNNNNIFFTQQVLVIKIVNEISYTAAQLSEDLCLSIPFNTPVLSSEEIKLILDKFELSKLALESIPAQVQILVPTPSIPTPVLICDKKEAEEEIVPGSVVIHKDETNNHFAIVLEIRHARAELLFLSSKEFGRRFRKATKDELALAGFVYTRPTNLCLVTRRINELYPRGLIFPEHRIKDLIKEFITGP